MRKSLFTPSFTLYTIVMFGSLLSLTGYLNGSKRPILMHLIIYTAVITSIYSCIFIVKKIEEKIEIRSVSLSIMGLIHSASISPFFFFVFLMLSVDLLFFTPNPNKNPDFEKSMGRFFLENIPVKNKVFLTFLYISTIIYYILTIIPFSN